MFNETTLTAVAWLILSAGLLMVVAGCLYILFWSVGKIIKILGFWDDFMRVTAMYYKEKRKKGKIK